MSRDEVLPEIVARLVDGFKPLRIILFGSVARGDDGPDSDIDLVVVLPGADLNHFEAWKAITSVLDDLPVPTDVHVQTAQELERNKYRLHSIYGPATREGKILYDGGYDRYVDDNKVDTSRPDPRLEVQEWLSYALDDFRVATDLLERGSAPRIICYHAQQAAEKAVKALLVHNGIVPPRTHDLAVLFPLVSRGWNVKRLETEVQMKGLKWWGTDGRYPSDLPKAEPEQEKRVYADAKAIWEAVTGDLGKLGIYPREV